MDHKLLAGLGAVLLASPALAQISTTGRLRPPAPEVDAPQPEEVQQEPSLPEMPAPAREREASPQPTLEEGGSLHLMCFGAGSANKTATATAYGWNSDGGFGNATIFGQRSQGFEDQVSLQMLGSEGQLRMPRTMLPIIRGGRDGWFKLSNVKIKANEITASISVNPLNNPKLRLDRYTGSISISGKAGDYSGQCQPYDPAAMQRRF